MARAHLSPRVAALCRRRAGIRLDVACGANKQGPDWVGIDRRRLPGVDIVHDLWRFPWPLPTACARAAAMSHYWEHVPPHLTIDTMAELHRIVQPGGALYISAPYEVGYRDIQDPTHCNPSIEQTWGYWDTRSPLWTVYKPVVWHVLAYTRVPAYGDTDFNAVLERCRGKACQMCPS